MRTVATAGRTIAWEGDDAWRRRLALVRAHRSGRRRKSGERRRSTEPAEGAVRLVPGDPDIGVTDDEVVLADSANVSGDASISLRLAVAAEGTRPSP